MPEREIRDANGLSLSIRMDNIIVIGPVKHIPHWSICKNESHQSEKHEPTRSSCIRKIFEMQYIFNYMLICSQSILQWALVASPIVLHISYNHKSRSRIRVRISGGFLAHIHSDWDRRLFSSLSRTNFVWCEKGVAHSLMKTGLPSSHSSQILSIHIYSGTLWPPRGVQSQ